MESASQRERYRFQCPRNGSHRECEPVVVIKDGMARPTGIFRCTQCSFGFKNLALFPPASCSHEKVAVTEHKSASGEHTISVAVCQDCGECVSRGDPG